MQMCFYEDRSAQPSLMLLYDKHAAPLRD